MCCFCIKAKGELKVVQGWCTLLALLKVFVKFLDLWLEFLKPIIKCYFFFH